MNTSVLKFSETNMQPKMNLQTFRLHILQQN
jgi:hypothetical protein